MPTFRGCCAVVPMIILKFENISTIYDKIFAEVNAVSTEVAKKKCYSSYPMLLCPFGCLKLYLRVFLKLYRGVSLMILNSCEQEFDASGGDCSCVIKTTME